MIHTDLIVPVSELLERHAKQRAQKVAFQDAVKSVTYAELNANTANLAGHLEQLGVVEGDRVAILLPNSVNWVISVLAVCRAGAVAVPISIEATDAEISYRLADAQCVLTITTSSKLEQLERVHRDLSGRVPMLIVQGNDALPTGHSFEKLTEEGTGSRPRDPLDIDRPTFVIYTSGTTGKAKGVLLSTRSMLWVVGACWVPIAGLNENDRLLSFLPLFHSYALNLSVLAVLAVGATEYIGEKYSTAEVLRLLQTGEYTVFPGVPTMFHYVLDATRDMQSLRFPGLRVCLSAGAIMPAAVNEQFETRFGVPLLDGYGITETSTMVTMNWNSGTRVMGSCGLPIPGVETRIVDPIEGYDVDPGKEGELIVRGPNVMKGYLNKPEETASALKNGWYHTGDLAKQDSAGYLTITGRLKEVIIRGGQNIAPAEVEESVMTFPGIADCAVVGVPHASLGEVPVAFVVVRAGECVDIEDLLKHCANRLSAYKVPHTVRITEDIPRTGSGKIMRFKLAELFSKSGA
ncbi:class I adenylate-forming enzyme family protein [Cupriavidus consociatus]|uniref:class I adenylate-forming enzyme family protein n=1 Tax=Cupriavidus consociatus TaxID=2821357 RepID=UPI001AE4E0B7|nr:MULTISPECIES: AMP-binding protein [unclassified Cupriavidus]MBP0623759.1 AMP-binding protein [Cupriavidus sp. LEh25]MDK2660466.1 AMP-binding protein [Cupriavidus sp. LEh21]